MVAERMEEAVGVGGDSAGAVGDRLAELAAGIESRQLEEAAPIHILMGGRIALDGGSGGFDVHRCGLGR